MRNQLLDRVTKLEIENQNLRKQVIQLQKTRPEIIMRVESEMILDTVYEVTGYTLAHLRSQSKPLEIAIIRQCVVYLLWKYAYMNKSSIAKFLCRHHTSVLYTIERVNDWHKYPTSFIIEMTMFTKLEDLIVEKIKEQ